MFEFTFEMVCVVTIVCSNSIALLMSITLTVFIVDDRYKMPIVWTCTSLHFIVILTYHAVGKFFHSMKSIHTLEYVKNGLVVSSSIQLNKNSMTYLTVSIYRHRHHRHHRSWHQINKTFAHNLFENIRIAFYRLSKSKIIFTKWNNRLWLLLFRFLSPGAMVDCDVPPRW